MDDNKIMDLYWARSEAAIAETANKYGRYCHYIAYNILHNHEDAEECVNEAYLGAWKSMPPQRPNRLSAFLGKITRNLSLNRFKQYTAEKRGYGRTEMILSELEDCIPTPVSVEQAMDEIFVAKSIENFLYAQPPIKRNVFIRRYWYLSAIRDIAEQYGISESKVSSMLLRLRKKLKLHLEREGIVL